MIAQLYNPEMRNYWVAKRSALAIKRYCDEHRTALIFRREQEAESCDERIGEHISAIKKVYDELSKDNRREIDELLIDGQVTELRAACNVLSQLSLKIRNRRRGLA